MDANVILLTLAHPQPLFFYAYLQSFQSFVTKVNDNPKKASKCTLNDFRFFAKINDSLGNRWLLRYISAFLHHFDCFEARITPCYTPYRFRLPSKTAYYLRLDRIMHPNFDCIKIGVLIWLGWRDLNPRDDRVKVCCLTAWLHPIIIIAEYNTK